MRILRATMYNYLSSIILRHNDEYTLTGRVLLQVILCLNTWKTSFAFYFKPIEPI